MSKSGLKLISETSYKTLLTQIRKEITKGIYDIEKLVEHHKVLTYWSVGKSIHQYISKDITDSGNIGEFYRKLSKDLNISDRTLQQCEQFSCCFDKKDLKEGLSWTHYRYLFVVGDKSSRKKWIERVLKNNWSSKDLRMNILLETKYLLETNANGKDVLESSKRGKLYTYHLIKTEEGVGIDTAWLIDCGFATRIEAPESDAVLHNKRIYTSVKSENGYKLKVVDSTVDLLYTYVARLIRVVDGDTLLVLIDQGFGIWTKQRLRLNAIDAPEMTTVIGRKAKQWVESEIGSLPFIIVKTYKSDKFDRYLVDVFYLKGEGDPHIIAESGKFLNQELLNNGFAKIYQY